MKKKKKYMITTASIIAVFVIVISIQINLFGFTNSAVYEVDGKHDDARTFTADLSEQGYGNEDGAWATLQISPSYSFGLRFTNVNIPGGAEIIDAYVELYSIGTPGHQHPNCRIYCDNVDDAANFSTLGVLNISGRIYTDNYARWNTTVEYSKWVKTPSIVDPVQEIIDREGWLSGNSLAILFVSEGLKNYSVAFQNYENGYPAKLYVEWK